VADASPHPLSPEEARARLRAAARRLTPSALVARHPLAIVAAGLAAGLLAGSAGKARAMQVCRHLAPLAVQWFLTGARRPGPPG